MSLTVQFFVILASIISIVGIPALFIIFIMRDDARCGKEENVLCVSKDTNAKVAIILRTLTEILAQKTQTEESKEKCPNCIPKEESKKEEGTPETPKEKVPAEQPDKEEGVSLTEPEIKPDPETPTVQPKLDNQQPDQESKEAQVLEASEEKISVIQNILTSEIPKDGSPAEQPEKEEGVTSTEPTDEPITEKEPEKDLPKPSTPKNSEVRVREMLPENFENLKAALVAIKRVVAYKLYIGDKAVEPDTKITPEIVALAEKEGLDALIALGGSAFPPITPEEVFGSEEASTLALKSSEEIIASEDVKKLVDAIEREAIENALGRKAAKTIPGIIKKGEAITMDHVKIARDKSSYLELLASLEDKNKEEKATATTEPESEAPAVQPEPDGQQSGRESKRIPGASEEESPAEQPEKEENVASIKPAEEGIAETTATPAGEGDNQQICGACGAESPINAKFCGGCGAAFIS